MSRSRKKTPIIGFTCAKSDKPWKAKAARSFRHATRQALSDGENALLPVKRWAVVNPWDAPKDGKHWIGAGEARARRGGCGSSSADLALDQVPALVLLENGSVLDEREAELADVEGERFVIVADDQGDVG